LLAFPKLALTLTLTLTRDCCPPPSPPKVRAVLVHPHPESGDVEWDTQVDATRNAMARY